MKLLADYCRELYQNIVQTWNRFWFHPADPATLGLIRILTGTMLFYTHLVWSLDLSGFFGARGRLSPEFVHGFHASPWAWTHFDWIESTSIIWILHGLALLVMAMLAIGLCSRLASVLAFLFTVSYAHRVPVALFGLDQINALLAMYLMVGPSGAAFSVDRWLAAREGSAPAGEFRDSIGANIAVRLIQVHMCVIYLFAGSGKLLGESWWNGTAMWGALANYEYQSLDMTWLAHWPLLVNALTHLVVLWEITYCFAIWPRLTRPLVLALAIPLHLGIAVCMGMITFGLVMLIGNLAFVTPAFIRGLMGRKKVNH